jgi:hypothetical protein
VVFISIDLEKECMEMVKYLAMVAAVLASLMVADSAQAFGHRGCKSCKSCCNGGGCPGGVCAIPVAPGKMAATTDAPPGLAAAPAAEVAPVAVAPVANQYASAGRRGLFGRR